MTSLLRAKYFCRRNWPFFGTAGLVFLGMLINNESVHLQHYAQLEQKRQAAKDSLYNSQMAIDLRGAWQNRSAYITDNIKSANGLNWRAKNEGRKSAEPFIATVMKLDSASNKAQASYVNFIAAGEAKIDLKYDKLMSGFNSKLPISDKTAFAVAIPLIAAAAISLMFSCYIRRTRKTPKTESSEQNKIAQNNPYLPLAEFVAALAAISCTIADFNLISYRLEILFQNFWYSIFGAAGFCLGIVVFTAKHLFEDRAELAKEMQRELDALAKSRTESQAEVAEPEVSAPRKNIFGVVRNDKHPLRKFDLSPYNIMSDMPTTAEECCEIYAAFEIQGVKPSWLSLRGIEDYLESVGVLKSHATLHKIKESYIHARRAA